jgi:virulence-associated protein VagC
MKIRTTTIIEDDEGQAIMIPDDLRFESNEVWISRDEATGEVFLTPKSRLDESLPA